MQGVLTAVVAMAFAAVNYRDGASALLAGLVMIAPNAWFAWRVAATTADADALRAARRLLGSGVAKLVSTFALLVVAFAWIHPGPVAFFVTMIVVQAAHWIAPLWSRDGRAMGG